MTQYTRNRIEIRVTDRAIAEQLVPMLMGEEPRQPTALVDQSWASISHLMTLTKRETEYIDSIQRGALCPDLLFPENPEEAHRVTEHPAILWKLLNVRAHLAKRKIKPGQRLSSRSRN